MTKVKVTREIAEAIVDVREMYTDSQIIAEIENDRGCTAYGTLMLTLVKFSRQAEGNIDLIMRALVNGYEIEKTPEERVRDKYAQILVWKRVHRKDGEYGAADGREDGFRMALEALGIKIEGVNA